MRRQLCTIRRILPLVLIGLTGCFSLARNAPTPRHFVLGGAGPRADETVSRDPDRITVGVRRLQLAPYLATPFVVVRRGSNQITFSEFQRWGEDLGVGINRTVAGYLAGRAPFADLDMAPWPVGTPHDYLIQLSVSRFEGVAPEALSAVEGEANVLATWEIVAQNGEVMARGTTDYREPGWKVGDYAGLVTLLDTGLDVLANDLATRLEELERRP
jgi:uncharacterized lipoprotein YmbA